MNIVSQWIVVFFVMAMSIVSGVLRMISVILKLKKAVIVLMFVLMQLILIGTVMEIMSFWELLMELLLEAKELEFHWKHLLILYRLKGSLRSIQERLAFLWVLRMKELRLLSRNRGKMDNSIH
jgi:hypothetical protein